MRSSSSHTGSNAHPLIDILLPVHNGSPFLAGAIESIQAQSEPSWRLIVLDDGSTDGSAAIAEAFAAGDRRIHLVRYPARGLITTLNTGLELCRAPFVARQDADDISLPERFAIELNYLQRHPQCIAVSSGGITIDQDGNRVSDAWYHDPERADPYWIPAREPYLAHPFLMARREIYQRLGYRNFFICEDADLCWRLQEAGSIHSIPKVLGYYRAFENSVSTRRAVNTRIQAIVSQLAAIDAQRRRAKRGDFDLDASLHDKMVEKNDFETIMAMFRDRLSAEEYRFFRSASIVKFMDIATYRPAKVNRHETRLAYRELHAISRSFWGPRNSIFDTCSRAYHALHKRGHGAVAEELAPGRRGRLVIALRQPWLLPLLPQPASER